MCLFSFAEDVCGLALGHWRLQLSLPQSAVHWSMLPFRLALLLIFVPVLHFHRLFPFIQTWSHSPCFFCACFCFLGAWQCVQRLVTCFCNICPEIFVATTCRYIYFLRKLWQRYMWQVYRVYRFRYRVYRFIVAEKQVAKRLKSQMKENAFHIQIWIWKNQIGLRLVLQTTSNIFLFTLLNGISLNSDFPSSSSDQNQLKFQDLAQISCHYL